MNITHTIRVLLDDGRCQKHYVECDKETIFEDFMLYVKDPQDIDDWVGWKIDNYFYLRENVTGFLIDEFKGIIVNANGYEVLCEDPNDLSLTIQAQMDARARETDALRAYLEKLMRGEKVDVHPIQGHEEVSPNPGDARSQGVDSKNKG